MRFELIVADSSCFTNPLKAPDYIVRLLDSGDQIDVFYLVMITKDWAYSAYIPARLQTMYSGIWQLQQFKQKVGIKELIKYFAPTHKAFWWKQNALPSYY